MIKTQTITVPTMFDESTAPKIGGEAIESVSQKAANALDAALSSGWRVVHCNPVVYMNVAYIHYVLEHDEAYPKQLLKAIASKCSRRQRTPSSRSC